jgi:hypothetical protein
MVRHQRAMSGTIHSMETLHNDLKDNTIIIGTYPPDPGIPPHPKLTLYSPRSIW